MTRAACIYGVATATAAHQRSDEREDLEHDADGGSDEGYGVDHGHAT